MPTQYYLYLSGRPLKKTLHEFLFLFLALSMMYSAFQTTINRLKPYKCWGFAFKRCASRCCKKPYYARDNKPTHNGELICLFKR